MLHPLRSKAVIIMFGFLLTLGMATVCQAQDSAKLKADKIIYHYEHQMVIAEGNAVISYRDLSVRADYIYLAVKENQMEAIGNLKITRGDEEYSGERLSYNLKEDHGYVEPLNLEIKNGDNGVLLGKGRQVELKGDTTIVRHGTLTSCDLERPHFHLKAAEIEYVPEVKLVFRHVYYYEGFMPVFYWPYLYISLKENESNLMTPVVGHDSIKGWFLLLGYQYFHDKMGNGVLHFDLYELLGYGYGVTHTFFNNERTKLETEYYRVENQNTGLGEDKVGVKFEKTIINWPDAGRKWKVSGMVNWIEEYTPLNNLKDNYYFQYSSQNKFTNFELSYNLRYKYLAEQWYSGSSAGGGSNYYDKQHFYINPSLNWRPFPDARLTMQGFWEDYYYKDIPEHNENYYLSLGYTQKIFKHPMDLAVTRSTYERVTLDLKSPDYFKLGWFEKVKWNSQLYRYIPYLDPGSNQEYLEGTRFGFTIDALSSPIYQKGGFSLSLSWWIKERQYWTNKGDGEQFAFSTPLVARQVFFEQKQGNVVEKSLVGELSAGWVEVNEKLPGYKDVVETITGGGDLTYRLTYDSKIFDASFNGGYNLTNQQWNSHYLNLTWLPTPESRINSILRFTPKNHVQKKDTGSVVTSIHYKPTPNHSFQLNHSYYIYAYSENHQTLNFVVDLEQPLGKLWTVKLNTCYDFLDENQRYTTVGLTYNMHCRKLTFTYDTSNELYMLQYTINAFPNVKLGFNSGTGMFWDGVDFWGNKLY
ncbi:MAG TPA: LPS-assembly protein LptD [Firmicutes bacterium]|nr:LPS-assembly protein LptD [Bacillota bacterium]